jgi:anti-anti-sigma factor
VLFDVQVAERGGWTVATVVGDVDLATLPRLWAALEPLGGPQLAIDMRGVAWFDPVCSGALVASAQRARRRGGRLVVVGGAPIAGLLVDTRLDQVLEVVGELPPSPGGPAGL